MSEFDIRAGAEGQIKVIRFADGDSCGLTIITLDIEGDTCFDSDYVKPENLNNFIKALQKAASLGWNL